MDYLKNGYVILALLLAITIVSAEETGLFESYDGVQWDFNYEDLPFLVSTVQLDDGETQEIEIRLYNTDIVYGEGYFKIIDQDNASNSSAVFTYDCGQGEAEVILGAHDEWTLSHYSPGLAFTIYAGDQNQTIRSAINETQAIDGSTKCNVSISGDDVIVATTLPINNAQVTTALNAQYARPFAIPDDAMAGIISGASGITVSVFSLMNMLLVISAMVLFIFILVFVWKLIVYVAKSVKGG